MQIISDSVGVALKPYRVQIGWRELMNCAAVVGDDNPIYFDDELRTLCQAKLADYKTPKKFFIRPVLPLLPSGKVNKVELRKEIK